MQSFARRLPLLVVFFVAAVVLVAAIATPADAQVAEQYIGRPVADVRFEAAGRPATDTDLADVVETRIGAPLSMSAVRETLVHLMALGRFESVEVNAQSSPGGVVLTFNLVPLRRVGSIVFRGTLGLDDDLLRREVTDRYGASPPLGRIGDIVSTLEGLYREHGFSKPVITRSVVAGSGTRATLTFDIDPGQRPRIGAVRTEGDNRLAERDLRTRLGIADRAPYDPSEITRRAVAYTDRLRNEGFYGASVEVTPRFVEDNTVNLDVAASRGPRVTVRFAGDPLPPQQVDQLVPIKTEKSVDQDLLEDWSDNIVRYLEGQGYRYASARVRRDESDDDLRIVFDVNKGPRHVIDGVEVMGNKSMPREDVLVLFGVVRGQGLVVRSLDAGAAEVVGRYHGLGFTAARAQPTLVVRSSSPAEVRTHVVLQIAEGPRTVVGSVRFFLDGREAPAASLPVANITTKPGAAFYMPTLANDRDNILLGYLNSGYLSASVSVPEVGEMVRPGAPAADVRFDVRTGPQYFVDHILLVGNNRTKANTIRNELQLKPGDPLALDKLNESQQRLSALGLFRRVRVTEMQQGSETRRDLIVAVDEAPATSVAYGGGVEGARRLRRDAAGNAVAAIELAPHGVFEIGRRNLWGGNRSINFNSSIAVRPNSTSVVGTGLREYRVLGTYREPRILRGAADLLVTGGVEQTVRTSYSFNRRSVFAQLAHRFSPTVSLFGRYSIERTTVFHEQVSPEERLLIDIRFPQVRISRLSSSVVRDTRDDSIDPSRGVLASADINFAPRFIGSEVGFVKGLGQMFVYRQLPSKRRLVFAGGARLGLATGFEQTTAGGEVVRDVPISERFFSGNSVRGFIADRLGRPDTLTPEGFPNGGNAVLIVNAELRTSVWKDFAVATFVDAGNVFLRASELDPTKIRAAVGFGFRYRSPIGPIRFDVGFNPSRRTFGNGTQEPLTSVYFGIGQAF